MRRVVAFLRSPKVAVWLLLGIVAYSAVAMSIPQKGLDPEEASAWRAAHPALASLVGALRLDGAFSAPLFYAAMVLLFLVTAACAWERTRLARGLLRPTGDSDRVVDALEKRPAVSVPMAGSCDQGGALDLAEDALRRSGYRVRRGARYLEADRHRWGAWGSPVFHWALVGLVVVIAAGTLARSEGVLDIPIGGRVADSTESYQGRVKVGPLYPGHSGLGIAARDFQVRTVVDGVDRGHSAVIDLYQGGRKVASRRVYPNSPLRYGSLLIHRDKRWGYAPLLSIETTGGQELARAPVLIDASVVTSAGAGPGVLYMTGGPSDVPLSVTIPYDPSSTSTPRSLSHTIRVSVDESGQPPLGPLSLAEGGSAPLGDALRVRFVSRGYFVRVAVADDWSVPYIYALFAIAAIALTVALFTPARRVWIAVVLEGEAWSLRAHWRRPQRDPAFADRIERLLRDVSERSVV